MPPRPISRTIRNSPQLSVPAGNVGISEELLGSVSVGGISGSRWGSRRRHSTISSDADSSRLACSSQAAQPLTCSATSLSSVSGRSPSRKADRVSGLGQAMLVNRGLIAPVCSTSFQKQGSGFEVTPSIIMNAD